MTAEVYDLYNLERGNTVNEPLVVGIPTIREMPIPRALSFSKGEFDG